MLLQEGNHALPGALGAGRVVGGAGLVEETVVGVVAVHVVDDAGRAHRVFQPVDGARRAPIVAVGEMALQRDRDRPRVGEFGRRDAVVADARIGFGDVHAAGDGQRAAHAEPHHRDLGAGGLEMPGGAAQVLMGGAGEVEPFHPVAGLVRVAGHAALVEIGRQRVEAGRGEAVGDAADLVVQSPPFLDHHDSGPAGARLGIVAARGAAVRPLERDRLAHLRPSPSPARRATHMRPGAGACQARRSPARRRCSSLPRRPAAGQDPTLAFRRQPQQPRGADRARLRRSEAARPRRGGRGAGVRLDLGRRQPVLEAALRAAQPAVGDLAAHPARPARHRLPGHGDPRPAVPGAGMGDPRRDLGRPHRPRRLHGQRRHGAGGAPRVRGRRPRPQGARGHLRGGAGGAARPVDRGPGRFRRAPLQL